MQLSDANISEDFLLYQHLYFNLSSLRRNPFIFSFHGNRLALPHG